MSRYEFALIRYVHDLSAGEFANVGVVLLDIDARRVMVRLSESQTRVSLFFRTLDARKYLAMMRHIEVGLAALNADLDRSPVVSTSLAEMLNGAMPDAESAFQASSIGSGVTESTDRRLEELFAEFISRYDAEEATGDAHEDRVKRSRRLEPGFTYVPTRPHHDYTFHTPWNVRVSRRRLILSATIDFESWSSPVAPDR